MITGNDNNLQMRIAPVRLFQEMKETALRRGGRVGYIEHITGNQQDICLLFRQGIHQPVQKGIVFFLPVVTEESLAEMPVGSMYNL